MQYCSYIAEKTMREKVETRDEFFFQGARRQACILLFPFDRPVRYVNFAPRNTYNSTNLAVEFPPRLLSARSLEKIDGGSKLPISSKTTFISVYVKVK